MKNPAKRLGSINEEEEIKTHPFFKRIDWEKIEAREVQPPSIPKLVSYFHQKYFILPHEYDITFLNNIISLA